MLLKYGNCLENNSKYHLENYFLNFAQVRVSNM